MCLGEFFFASCRTRSAHKRVRQLIGSDLYEKYALWAISPQPSVGRHQSSRFGIAVYCGRRTATKSVKLYFNNQENGAEII